jgi:hypothetical protein
MQQITNMHGSTILTPATYGPFVDYADNGFSSYILQDYVSAAFQDCGYSPFGIIDVDARFYHNGQGSIHFATNVIRDIPSSDWWND